MIRFDHAKAKWKWQKNESMKVSTPLLIYLKKLELHFRRKHGKEELVLLLWSQTTPSGNKIEYARD